MRAVGRVSVTMLAAVIVASCAGSPAVGVDAADVPRGMDAVGNDTAVDAALVDTAPGDASDAPVPLRCPGPFGAPDPAERGILTRMGVPQDAGCVVILSQSSHLDIDWQRTFDGYYRAFVDGIFGQAHDLLGAQPAYRYSVAEMAYLTAYLARHPEQAADFRAAAGRGALRIVGGGITSPDTLLPTTEPLVRDYLRGSLVADRQLGVRARAAWLPDSFGHSPTVPDLLAGMGYTAVGFARVDGLHDFTEVLFHQQEIVPGSTAEMLTAMHSTDFVWVGPGGGEVLAHWMPTKTYCQGDNLDHDGIPVPGGWIGNDHTGDTMFTDAAIAGYVSNLGPMARTPYMFVPVGCDFQSPKPHLLDAIAHWNAVQYPTTGAYVVAATFEDYADLVNERRGDLPRMTRDITPYFTGYFGSRLAVKAGTRAVGDLLAQTEVTAKLAQTVASAAYPTAAFATTWDAFARTDHHDYITGTSLDDVVTSEQLPALAALQTSVAALETSALGALATALPAQPGAIATVGVVGTVGATGPRAATVQLTLPPGAVRDLGASVPLPVLAATRDGAGMLSTASVLLVLPSVVPASVQRVGLTAGPATGPVTVTRTATDVTLRDTSTGLTAHIDPGTGSLTALSMDGASWITAPSLTLTGWNDQGGLYRIGSETASCTFASTGPPAGDVTVTVLEQGPARARVQVQHGPSATITVGMTAGMRTLDVDVQAQAPEGQTLTVGLATTVTGSNARFAQAAGVVTRPPDGLYTPTFWPTVRGMDLVRADGSGIAVLPRVSTGVRYGTDGTIDVMVDRNAVSERCDVLGAMGHDQGMPTVSLSLRPHGAGMDLVAEAMALLTAPAVQLTGAPGTDRSGALWTLGGTGYVVSAVKPAERGTGDVLRVERTAVGGTLTVASGLAPVGSLTRTDLLEYDLGGVGASVTLDGALVTLRVSQGTP